jgi:hypothetical protein
MLAELLLPLLSYSRLGLPKYIVQSSLLYLVFAYYRLSFNLQFSIIHMGFSSWTAPDSPKALLVCHELLGVALKSRSRVLTKLLYTTGIE